MKKILDKLGLLPIEENIYEALLQKGHLSISEISEETGLYRPQIYKHLPLLIQKNLASESRLGKRKVYLAESPKQLLHLAENIKDEISEMLPGLLERFESSGTKPVLKYFDGEKGIKFIYKDLVDTCKKGDVFYRYESVDASRSIRQYVPKEYFTRFRDKVEVQRYIITNERVRLNRTPRLGRIMKVVPAKYDLFSYDMNEIIYGNKVAFIDFRSKAAILIESPTFAEFQRKIFKLLFDKLD